MQTIVGIFACIGVVAVLLVVVVLVAGLVLRLRDDDTEHWNE